MPRRLMMLIFIIATNSTSFLFAGSMRKPELADQYLDLIITYSVYAKSIWHDADTGGYWGGGIKDPAGDNGAVRGMCGIMLGYATLVRATDEHWLTEQQAKTLHDAGLDRDTLLKYVRDNLLFITAHHKSASEKKMPQWG